MLPSFPSKRTAPPAHFAELLANVDELITPLLPFQSTAPALAYAELFVNVELSIIPALQPSPKLIAPPSP